MKADLEGQMSQGMVVDGASTSPALSNVENEKPDSEKQKKKNIILLVITVVIVIIIAVWIVLIILNNKPAEEEEAAPQEDYSEQTVTDFRDINVTSSELSYLEVEQYLENMLLKNNVLDGCYTTNEKNFTILDGKCVSNHIDEMINDFNITDANQLIMLNIRKASYYISSNDPEAAWDILSNIDESKLFANQLPIYYRTMSSYYSFISDEANATLYYEKYQAVSIEDMS